MSDDDHKTVSTGRYASSPCMAEEVAPGYFDPLAVDPQQALDVARWRKAERMRLRAARQDLSVADRASVGAAIAAHLRALLQRRFDGGRDRVISAYWPIKGEPDLRGVMTDLYEAGVTVALPIVERKAAPLVFRRWTPRTGMVRGDWNIPVPSAESPAVTPDITLGPLVGWDGAGYRLGYGGGYFDRTFAALAPRPVSIGIGFQAARLATIYPQPHDVPFDFILTEDGIQVSPEAP